MSERDPIQIYLADDQATTRLAERLAPVLVAGDTVLLHGPIGSGKSHFCRGLIRARLGRYEDIPSPTFTLVQTYAADVDIWHADLYRLSHPDEARELGLEEAFDTAICLIEWPDRLGALIPLNAIHISLSTEGQGRRIEIDPGNRSDLRALLETESLIESRATLCQTFLARTGWLTAKRQALSGDASSRRYERLTLNGATRLLMDAPPGQADRVEDFAHVAAHLLAVELSAPIVFDADMRNGFLLIEDFGDGVFARLMEDDTAAEEPLYIAALDTLAHLQACKPAANIPTLSNADWAESAAVVLDWYCFAITGDRPSAKELTTTLEQSLTAHASLPRVMILRDFHAENLMWLPDRNGLRRVGLLDFQLAQMGQPGYDLVSLLQDARRDVSQGTEEKMIWHYLGVTGRTEAEFMPGYASLGALRALRVLGIFARLCLVSGKESYVALIPRVWGHLQRNLQHSALHDLNRVCRSLLPAPDRSTLERIRGQCGNFRS